jgi:phosphoglycolate phosphatase-like HAD superfamily hydrolase
MVGDTLKDIEAGARAGAQGILVRTGYGSESAASLIPGKGEPFNEASALFQPVYIAEDILAAAHWIVRNR